MDESADGGSEEAARRGLDLLSTIGPMLDAVDDDYAGAIEALAAACVPSFADLCVIEVIGTDGTAFRASAGTGRPLPERWVDLIREVVASGGGGATRLGAVREQLGAGSVLVAPIVAGGATQGWLAAATGADRPGFDESDRQVGKELCGRVGATIQRVALRLQLQASAREQGRVAHDLNNHLTLILGYSELLGRAIADPQLRSLAGEISGAARRAAGLTQELLESSSRDRAAPAPSPAEAAPAVTPITAPTDAREGRAADGEGWPPGRTLAGRILYVEDEPALRRAGQETLAVAGLDVVVAESAEAALSILAGDVSFDALVTDIALPGLSGIQLVRALRVTQPDVRVLYVTGYSGAPDPDHTPAPGEPVLRKPYQPDTLRLRVAELLERPESRGSELVHGS